MTRTHAPHTAALCHYPSLNTFLWRVEPALARRFSPHFTCTLLTQRLTPHTFPLLPPPVLTDFATVLRDRSPLRARHAHLPCPVLFTLRLHFPLRTHTRAARRYTRLVALGSR